MLRGEQGDPGERGKVGDHGQDGRQGERGERGLPGVPDGQREVDREVREALAVALGEKTRKKDEQIDRHLRAVDRRVFTVAAFVLGGMLLFMFVDERAEQRDQDRDREFRQQIVANCEQVNEGNRKVNALLGQLATVAMTNAARTDAENRLASERYRGLLLPISKCPPR